MPVLNLAQREALRLEEKYSRYRSDSVTSIINAQAYDHAVEVDAETAGLLNYAHICFEQSDGLFDITSGVLRRVWDFKQQNLPSVQDVNACLVHVGWQKVNWNNQHIQFTQADMEIDFGGVVKEFSADRLADLCYQNGINAGLIELGGDIRVIGPKQDEQGQTTPWMIGIRHPQTGLPMASIPLTEGGVATSGSYERFIMSGDKRYCHILNPKTGWPVEGVASVSIIAPQCLVAGSLSTIAMLKGHQAENWLEEQDVTFLMLTEEGKVTGSFEP